MTNTKNNVAAQAGDEQTNFDDQIAKITPTQLATWRAEVSRLNDLIAHASGVQAGEEPIYCPFCGDAESQTVEHVEGTIVHPAYFVRCDNCGAVGPTSDRGDHRQLWNARVSPRATADVELRDVLNNLRMSLPDVLPQHAYKRFIKTGKSAKGSSYAAASPAVVLSLIAQVEALTVPQWISVEDRLPGLYTEVLVTGGYLGSDVELSSLELKGFYAIRGQERRIDSDTPDDITHWMPLPTTPTIPAIPGTKEGA